MVFGSRFPWGVVLVLASGCFSDPTTSSNEPSDDDDDAATTNASTEGMTTATPSSGSTTDAPDNDDDDNGDTSTGGDETLGADESTSSTGDACAAGDAGCPCGDGCADGLTCVEDTCTECGDGEIQAPEECDGDIDGGSCVECSIECDSNRADCDGDPANGCEVDLREPTDCGACHHDCLGGECLEQECQPVDIAQSQDQPLGLDVESGTLFWSNVTGGEVYAHSVEPGGPPTLIATGLTFPETVVADGSKVYWADTNGGGIGRANYDGSLPEPDWLTAANATNTRLLVNGPSHLYLMRVTQGAYRVDKITPVSVPAISTGWAWGGFLDGETLYWSDHSEGEIRSADVSAGAPFVVNTIVADAPTAYAVHVHDGVLYWTTDGTGSDGTVNAMPIGGGDTVQFTNAARFPEDIEVDDDYVYWVEWESEGSLYRARHDGTEVTAVLPAFSAGIEQDDQAIYWVDQTGGRIRKLAKPVSPSR